MLLLSGIDEWTLIIAELAQETQQLSEAQKGAAASQPVKVAEPSTGQAVEASQSADGGEITRTQAEAGAEEEQSQQAAFNPETGEINWDCPCLGALRASRPQH